MKRKIAVCLCLLFISVVLFLVIRTIPLNLYLLAADIILLAAVVMYFNIHNKQFILTLFVGGIANGIAYVLIRIFSGNVASYCFCGRECIFYIGLFFTMALYAIMGFALIVFAIKDKRAKSKGEEKAKISFRESKVPISDWFIDARRYDLFRMEDYLSNENIVGVNGQWGAGKSVLSQEFYERHKAEVYRITIDVLTCNKGELDVFLICELEKLLIENHIFTKNAAKIKRILAQYSFWNSLQALVFNDQNAKSTVLADYKQDIIKLGKPVIVFVEDLDRMVDERAVRRILDFSERLSCDSIKFVFEYNADNLLNLNIDRNYIQKYIPYVVNLTPIRFQNVIEYYADQGMVNAKDYRFLTNQIYPEQIVQDELGLTEVINYDWVDAPIRTVKTFLTETKYAIDSLDISQETDIRHTIIAFMFMKHFSHEIYEELKFQYDILDEIKFVSPESGKKYSMQELFNEVRRFKMKDAGKNGLTLDEVGSFFQNEDPHEKESEIQLLNRAKYAILCLLGYNFQYMDDKYKKESSLEQETNSAEKIKAVYADIYQTEVSEMEHYERNDKINRLVRNLHANGLSENTNQEAFAAHFIHDVLDADDMKTAWEKFRICLWGGGISRDNNYGFPFFGEHDVVLAKALAMYLDKDRPDVDRNEAWIKFLDFRYGCQVESFDKEITPEYISFCYYVDVQDQEVFLYQIREFNKMEIAGNLKGEKIYREFIKKYINYGFKLGYVHSPSGFRLDYLVENNGDVAFAISYLQDLANRAKEWLDSGSLKDSALKDQELVRDFIIKNIEILKCETAAKEKSVSVKSDVRSVPHYLDEETYTRLKEYSKEELDEKRFIDELNKAYENHKLSIREMLRLKTEYDEI